MAFVYILKSERDGRYYVGSTTDINRRFKQHQENSHSTSKRMGPFRLEFYQEYPSLNIARSIENRIKRFKRRDFIEKIIRNQKISIRARSSVG